MTRELEQYAQAVASFRNEFNTRYGQPMEYVVEAMLIAMEKQVEVMRDKPHMPPSNHVIRRIK